MMNFFITSIFLLMITSVDIQVVVKEFHNLKTKQAEIEFLEKYADSSDPSVLAYTTSIAMKQAEYSYNPFNKIKIFQTNKKRLNELLKLHDSNIHLHYVRLLAQLNAPSFLGYNDFMEEDKEFLKKKLEIKDETDYLDIYINENISL